MTSALRFRGYFHRESSVSSAGTCAPLFQGSIRVTEQPHSRTELDPGKSNFVRSGPPSGGCITIINVRISTKRTPLLAFPHHIKADTLTKPPQLLRTTCCCRAGGVNHYLSPLRNLCEPWLQTIDFRSNNLSPRFSGTDEPAKSVSTGCDLLLPPETRVLLPVASQEVARV